MSPPQGNASGGHDDRAIGAQIAPASREERTRDALTRVLAIEGRNALARVELAASELARFETPPSLRDRIDTIRSAVCEIDGLLGKIDRLSAGPPRSRGPAIEVARAWERVCRRLAASLATRGIVLEAMSLDERSVEAGVRVTLPSAVLDRLLFALLRASVSGIDAPLRVRGLVARSAQHVWIGLERSTDATAGVVWAIDRASRVELEIQLAEWDGQLDCDSAERVGFRLPIGARDD